MRFTVTLAPLSAAASGLCVQGSPVPLLAARNLARRNSPYSRFTSSSYCARAVDVEQTQAERELAVEGRSLLGGRHRLGAGRSLEQDERESAPAHHRRNSRSQFEPCTSVWQARHSR